MRERCDIVMPVWNHAGETVDCVNSIKRYTACPYRIVIVDNASDEQTKKRLDSLKEENAGRVVIIANPVNTGFVKAVNQGMRFSDAPYVCILNNDTTVTPGWLGEMIDIFKGNPGVGIVNPSSNTFGDVYSGAIKNLRGKYQELCGARAFAVVIKKEVIEKIGYLDEAFGMGYFDDVDYSKRAGREGFKTVKARASYVYHKESVSFSKIAKKSDIFRENEKKFISKWGAQLRIAYVLPGAGREREIEKISSNINRIADLGHHAWIFTKRGLNSKLRLIDHEAIRFFYCPRVFFGFFAFYKIWERRNKKKLDLVLTNGPAILKSFKFFKSILAANVMPDSDFVSIEKKISVISFGHCEPLTSKMSRAKQSQGKS